VVQGKPRRVLCSESLLTHSVFCDAPQTQANGQTTVKSGLTITTGALAVTGGVAVTGGATIAGNLILPATGALSVTSASTSATAAAISATSASFTDVLISGRLANGLLASNVLTLHEGATTLFQASPCVMIPLCLLCA
jgi:hypothetical protein